MQLEMSIMETIVLFPLWTNWLDNSTGERKVCNQKRKTTDTTNCNPSERLYRVSGCSTFYSDTVGNDSVSSSRRSRISSWLLMG